MFRIKFSIFFGRSRFLGAGCCSFEFSRNIDKVKKFSRKVVEGYFTYYSWWSPPTGRLVLCSAKPHTLVHCRGGRIWRILNNVENVKKFSGKFLPATSLTIVDVRDKVGFESRVRALTIVGGRRRRGDGGWLTPFSEKPHYAVVGGGPGLLLY